MVRTALLTVVIVGLVFASSAAGYTVTRPDGQVRRVATAWAEGSLEPLPREAGVVLNTDPADVKETCFGSGACTWAASPAIYLDPSEGEVRMTFFHELGHRFDYTQMTSAKRLRFRVLAGIRPARPWRGAANPPAERFAEAYGLCALGREPRLPLTPTVLGNWINGAYGYAPTVRQHRRICRWLARVPGP